MNAEFAKIAAKGLSIERLNTFCQIVEAGTIARAAKGDSVRQSQYSRQLKDLEGALGVRLFLRTGRNWTLTEQGRRLVLLTRTYFHELDEMSGSSSDQSEVIKIAAGESVLNGVVFPRYGELRQIFPNSIFQFSCFSTNDLLESLNQGTSDFVIIREDVLSADHKSDFFCNLEFKLVVPRSLLREKMASGIEILRSLPVGMLSGEGTYATAIGRLAKDANINLKIAVKVPAFPQMCEIMRTGNIGGIVPSWHALEFPSDQFAIPDLDELKTLSKKLVLAYHRKTAELRPSIRNIAIRFKSIWG